VPHHLVKRAAAITGVAPTQAASAPQALRAEQGPVFLGRGHRGGKRADHRHGVPSSDSSPSATVPSTSSRGMMSSAASSASAMGRSKCEPSFGRSAGERLTVIRFDRQRDGHRLQRRAHPFARLAHRLVGQAHQREGRAFRGDGALHLDQAGLDALEGHCIGPRHHVPAAPFTPFG
jgi:hypothetical protein